MRQDRAGRIYSVVDCIMQEADSISRAVIEPGDRSVAVYDPRPLSKRMAAVTLAAVSVVFLVSVFYRPSMVSADGQYFTICFFKTFTGLPCPGCGLTHSFCELGKGNVMQAFRFNLLGPAAFGLTFLLWLRSLMVLAGRPRLAEAMDRAASRVKLIPALALAFLVFGLTRIIYLLVDKSY